MEEAASKRDLGGVSKTATKAESVCKQNRAALVFWPVLT
jgi:hypothetical protein